MNAEIFGKRLKIARKKSGLSLRKLSEILQGQISHTAISRYEKGEMMPSSDVLIKLVNSLNISMDYLFKDNIPNLSLDFRKHSNLSKREEERVVATAIESLERYIEVSSLLGLDFSFNLKKKVVKTPEQAIERGKNIRDELLLGEAPILDLTSILEEASIVITLITAEPKFIGMCLTSENAAGIAVNNQFDCVRKRFTLAHELGHLVMDCSELSEKEEEKLCHIFAGSFLLPPSVLRNVIGSSRSSIFMQELISIKEEYGISIQAIGAQLALHGIISYNRYKHFNILLNEKGWRKNEPGTFLDKEKPQLLRRLTLRALATESISISKASQLLEVDQFDIMKMETVI
jgi:Zn-dependent peptidase ImmA (M78 family)/DNA-binding XRE family transcriptional regulator